MNLPPASARPSDENHMIPLINIVFLLLIFFMVAGVIEAQGVFQLEPPESEISHQVEVRELLLQLDAEGNTALENDVITLDALAAALPNTLSDVHIHIKADANASTADLLAVMDALRDAGVTQVTLLALLGHDL